MAKKFLVCLALTILAATGALMIYPVVAPAHENANHSWKNPELEAKFEQDRTLLQEAAFSWHENHDLRKAKTIFQQLVQSDSQLLPDALIGLARIEDEQGHSKEALHYYDALLGPHPNWNSSLEDEPAVVGRFAELCEEQGRYEDALAAYSKVLKLGSEQDMLTTADHNVPIRIDTNDPTEIKARALILIGLAHQLNQAGELHRDPIALKRSLTAYQTAVRLEPNLAITHYYLAYGLKFQGKTREAAAEYAMAEKVGGPEFSAAMHKAERDLQAKMAQSERNSRIVHVSSMGPNSPPVTWSEYKHPELFGGHKSSDTTVEKPPIR